jgi:hypothetical protein
MPRPYPALQIHHKHISPYLAIALFLTAVTALLLPTTVSAGDRDGYSRSTYYTEGEQYAGDNPYLDDSYHSQYDRKNYRSTRYHGYSRSYERDYNGRDYACGCRRGRETYYRTYNWKGEHEYRQSRRSAYNSSYGNRYDDGY